MPLFHRPLAMDGVSEAIFEASSSGVSIARNTVFVAAGNHVLAYRPPDDLNSRARETTFSHAVPNTD
jgi:hypothetical protein